MPAHEALIHTLVHVFSNSTLINLVALIIDSKHAQCLVAEEASDVFGLFLVTVGTFSFIILG